MCLHDVFVYHKMPVKSRCIVIRSIPSQLAKMSTTTLLQFVLLVLCKQCNVMSSCTRDMGLRLKERIKIWIDNYTAYSTENEVMRTGSLSRHVSSSSWSIIFLCLYRIKDMSSHKKKSSHKITASMPKHNEMILVCYGMAMYYVCCPSVYCSSMV